MKTPNYKFSLILSLNLIIWVITGSCQKHTYESQPLKVVKEVDSHFDEDSLRIKMRADGLTDAVIDKLIAHHKELADKGLKLNWTRVTRLGNNPPGTCSTCADLGGENGWGAYQGSVGDNSGGNPPIYGAAGAPQAPNFNLNTGLGFDPCTPGVNVGDPPIPVVAPGFGNTSLELGEIQTAGSVAEQLTYPLTVTAKDSIFIYTYALVLEDAPHNPGERPFADFAMLDPNGDTIPCAHFHYEGADDFGTALPGFYDGSCGAHYKPWKIVGVNLTNYIGKTVTVIITNADCIYGGHFAQSYWDFSCGVISGNVSDFCPGQADTLNAPVDPLINYTYFWSPSGQTTQQIVAYPHAGDTISLLVKNPDGCNFSLVYAPQRMSITPNFTTSSVCGNVSFTDSSYTSNSQITVTGWKWSFPGGSPSTSSDQNPGPISYVNGSHDITLTVSTAAGCVGTATKTITTSGNPTAEFCFSPDQASISAPQFSFCNEWSADVVKWYWDFGDGSDIDSINTNPVHSYSASVSANDFYSFKVTLKVLNRYGCRDTIVHTVEIVPDFSFFIPNCFTPNTDYANDMFFAKGRGIEDYTIWIYDRWGNVVWTCHNEGSNVAYDNYGQEGISESCKWDGVITDKIKSKDASEDVYVWKVQLRNVFKKDMTYLGRVTVLR